MSMRMRFVLAGVGAVVVLAGWFLMVFRPGQARQAELRDDIAATEQEISSLEAQLRRLQDLQAREPELRAEEARFALALPDVPSVPAFLIQVQDAANQAGVDFVSINPSLPTAPRGGEGASGIQSISVSISSNGSFFAVQDFVYRMERLDRAVRIDNFSLSGGGDEESPTLSVSLRMQMFNLPPGSPAPATGVDADDTGDDEDELEEVG